MADDEIQLRILVHRAGHGKPHHMQRHFVVPAPGKGGEPEIDVFRKSLVIGLAHVGGRHAGMDVDRHIELFRPRQQRRELGIVEKRAADRAADQGALEAERGDGALQFVRRRFRDARRQMRECGKAIGPLGDFFGKAVVEFLRKRDRLLAVELIGAGRDVDSGLRQHLHGDAVTIHVGEPAVTDVGHLVRRIGDHVGHIAGGGRRCRRDFGCRASAD